jgi:nucleoside-diphosphate-sugar epimerase
MRALVIGGTGLSGPYLLRELTAHGHDVAAFHRGQHEAELPPGVSHVHGDLRDAGALAKAARDFSPQAVVHMYAMNPGDVERAVQAFAGHAERLVLVSSGDVYAAFEDIERRRPRSQRLPIREDAPQRSGPYLPPHPSDYDKLGAERAALAAAEAGKLDVAILRYPALYGPGPSREWYWVKRILDGRSLIALPDAGMSLFHRGFAVNVAHAVVLALENGRSGTAYNVGDRAVYSVRQITDMIAEIMGHSWEVSSVPAGAWLHGTPYSLPGRLVYDLTKITSELSYEDVVAPEEALRLTVEHLVANPPGRMPFLSPQAFDYAAEDEAIQRSRV